MLLHYGRMGRIFTPITFKKFVFSLLSLVAPCSPYFLLVTLQILISCHRKRRTQKILIQTINFVIGIVTIPIIVYISFTNSVNIVFSSSFPWIYLHSRRLSELFYRHGYLLLFNTYMLRYGCRRWFFRHMYVCLGEFLWYLFSLILKRLLTCKNNIISYVYMFPCLIFTVESIENGSLE